jgi:diguanylate cyclase (GGDEF)-like protein/PAS domain S-box-containing protein
MYTPDHLFKDNFLDLLMDAVCVVNRDNTFLFVSGACERIFGYVPAEMIGKCVFDFVHPDDHGKTRLAIADMHEGQHQTHFENRYVRKDGALAHIMWSARWSDTDQVRVAVARDVSSLKRAEILRSALYAVSEAAHEAEDLQAFFSRIHQTVNTLVPNHHFLLALRDPQSGELDFPYSTLGLNELPSQAMVTRNLCMDVLRSGNPLLLTEDSATAPDPTLGQAGGEWLGVPLPSAGGLLGALLMQNHAGAVRYTEQDKELLHFVSVQVAAAIERKRIQTRLAFMAQHDALTGLPNRALFLDRLQNALALAHREQSRLAVLYIDMEGFKSVNDKFGHLVGDKLLQQIGLRLKRSIRASDTVARLGGDEFVVMLNGIESAQDAKRVAGKVLVAMSRLYAVEEHSLQILPSLGMAVYPEDGETDDALLRHADNAMYEAKRRGQSVSPTAVTPPFIKP